MEPIIQERSAPRAAGPECETATARVPRAPSDVEVTTMRNYTRMLSGLAALAALVVLAGGCIFSPDDDVINPPVPPSYPFPATQDLLMTNFQTAYDQMNIEEYRNVLHTEFVFKFAEGSNVEPSGYYTREQDLQTTTRMFNGEQGMSEIGEVKPGVRDIDFRLLQRISPFWEDVPDTDPDFPGSTRAVYDVEIVFNLSDEGNSTITVESQQIFYAMPVAEVQEDSSIRQRYYLRGQTDLDSQ